MKTPTISIIIPVYNAEKYLARCIDSLQDQTFGDFEALFIDDCSVDASTDLIKSRQKDDPRIRLIELAENGGSGVARNAGIEIARGEYLSFIDVDDTVSNDFLEELYGKARETSSDVVKGSCVYVFNEKIDDSLTNPPNSIKRSFDNGTKLFLLLVKEHWSAIYRRDFIEKHHIRYGLNRVSQDTVFLLKVGFFAKTFETAENARYYYYNNEGSTTRTFSYARFVNSLLSVSEIVDFINENVPFSNEFAAFLSSILRRRMPVHSYLCVQDALKEKAPEYISLLYDILIGYKNINALMEYDYAVRVLIESEGVENIAANGRIIGMADNTEWQLRAFEKLVEHLNSETADKKAGIAYLCGALCEVESVFSLHASRLSKTDEQKFCFELKNILSKLEDKTAFIEKGGMPARAMLEYGVNLFIQIKGHDPLKQAYCGVEVLERLLYLIEKYPDASPDYIAYAQKVSNKTFLNICKAQNRYQNLAAKISFKFMRLNKRLMPLSEIHISSDTIPK